MLVSVVKSGQDKYPERIRSVSSGRSHLEPQWQRGKPSGPQRSKSQTLCNSYSFRRCEVTEKLRHCSEALRPETARGEMGDTSATPNRSQTLRDTYIPFPPRAEAHQTLPEIPSDGKIIIIGDPHGCIDELTLLIEKCQYNPHTDKVVIVGDLVNKGTSDPLVVGFIQPFSISFPISFFRTRFNWGRPICHKK